MNLVRLPNFHAFAFAFDMAKKRPECGISFRARRGKIWRHVHIAFYTVGTRYRVGRGVLGFEAKAWRTLDGTGDHRRLGMKAFFRIKIGLGGNRPEGNGNGHTRGSD